MEYKKILKPEKRTLIICIILIIITIGMFYFSNYWGKQKVKQNIPEDYNELISNEEDVEEKYVEIEIVDIPYHVATKTQDNVQQKFYIVFDKDNLMYLVRLSDKTYNKLDNMYNQNKEEFSYTLKGYIYNTPSELKRITIDVYNKAKNEKVLNLANFKLYFGNTYLDETKSPYDTISSLLMALGIFTTVLSVILLITYIVTLVNFKKVYKNYEKEDIESELDKTTTIVYKKENIYLTDKYIISTLMGLHIVEYKDLVWIYNERRKYNGVTIGRFLLAYKNNNKKLQLASSKKNEEILNEIIVKIQEKNPEIMIGFTNENIKRYKEIKKTKK